MGQRVGELVGIGKVLETERKKKGMKADDVAVICNVSRGQYYQWERSRHILKKNIPLLAKALGLSESKLTRVNNRYGRADDRDGGTGASAA